MSRCGPWRFHLGLTATALALLNRPGQFATGQLDWMIDVFLKGQGQQPLRETPVVRIGVRAAWPRVSVLRGCAGARVCRCADVRAAWALETGGGTTLPRTAVGLTAAGEGRGCARVSRETWTEDRASGFPGAVFCSGARLSASGRAGTRTSGGSVTSAFGYPEVTPLAVWEVAVTPVARRHRRRGRRRTDQP